MFRTGVDVITSGNHIWDKKEILEMLERDSRLLRPANYSPLSPGRGHTIATGRNGQKFAVLNLQGRVFMGPSEDPFRIGEAIVDQLLRETNILLVDMHGEASSEKQAMGWFLDGKVTAVCGTHTHVPTADHRILPGGTAFVTDIGMTGPYDSIIGMDREPILQRFLDGMPVRFEPAKENPILQAVMINADPIRPGAPFDSTITIRGERIMQQRSLFGPILPIVTNGRTRQYRLPPKGPHIYTVAELNTEFKFLLESTYSFGLGGGRNLELSPARVRSFLFQPERRRIANKSSHVEVHHRVLKWRPENGMKVIVNGRISVYEPRGELSDRYSADRAARQRRFVCCV